LQDAKNIKHSQFEFVALYGFTNVSGGISDRCLIAGFEIIGISIGTTEVVDNQLLTMISWS
jgi:DHA1 family bicyclomycin/chloramphenicol resistance-like MFS transporter